MISNPYTGQFVIWLDMDSRTPESVRIVSAKILEINDNDFVLYCLEKNFNVFYFV